MKRSDAGHGSRPAPPPDQVVPVPRGLPRVLRAQENVMSKENSREVDRKRPVRYGRSA